MVYCKTETNLCPLDQRSGNAMLIREVQLHCPATRWCLPCWTDGLGIHDINRQPQTDLLDWHVLVAVCQQLYLRLGFSGVL